MKLAWGALAVFVLVTSCKDDPAAPKPAAFESGSRLKVKVYRAGDAEQFLAFRDSLNNELCDTATAADGALRCLPGGGANEVQYTDPGCANPVVALPISSPCGTPVGGSFAAMSERTPDACAPARRRIFALGAAIATPGQTFTRAGTSTCSPVFNPPGRSYVALGAEVPPSSFVKMKQAEEARGPGLVAVYLVGEDGSRLLKSARDLKHDVACSPMKTASGYRCVPDGPVTSGYTFVDRDCTTEGAAFFSDCGDARFGRRAARDAANVCSDSVTSIYTLGPRQTAGSQSDGAGKCRPSTLAIATLGAQVPDQEFPSLERVVVGEGAVRNVEWRSDGAVVARDPQFQTASGHLCLAQKLADGKSHCAPPTLLYLAVPPSPSDVFADAACTQRVAFTSECEPPEFIVMSQAETCAGEREFQRGASVTGGLYKLDGSKACVAATAEANQSYFLVGPEVLATTFTEVVTVEL